MFGDFSSAPAAESLTTCVTPASLALLSALRTCSVARSDMGARRKSFSTPFIAALTLSALLRSNCTDSAPFGAGRECTAALTFRPLLRSCFTTSLPTVPVAPVTRIIVSPRHACEEDAHKGYGGLVCGHLGRNAVQVAGCLADRGLSAMRLDPPGTDCSIPLNRLLSSIRAAGIPCACAH